MTNLLTAGGTFALGLIFCWLSGCGGFFALAHRADRDHSSGEEIRQSLYMYYEQTNDKQKEAYVSGIAEKGKEVVRHHKGFVRWRRVAIVFSVLSLVTFVAGNVEGGWAVLHAPIKPPATAPVQPSSAKP